MVETGGGKRFLNYFGMRTVLELKHQAINSLWHLLGLDLPTATTTYLAAREGRGGRMSISLVKLLWLCARPPNTVV